LAASWKGGVDRPPWAPKCQTQSRTGRRKPRTSNSLLAKRVQPRPMDVRTPKTSPCGRKVKKMNQKNAKPSSPTQDHDNKKTRSSEMSTQKKNRVRREREQARDQKTTGTVGNSPQQEKPFSGPYKTVSSVAKAVGPKVQRSGRGKEAKAAGVNVKALGWSGNELAELTNENVRLFKGRKGIEGLGNRRKDEVSDGVQGIAPKTLSNKGKEAGPTLHQGTSSCVEVKCPNKRN